jgi:hypothetical protein
MRERRRPGVWWRYDKAQTSAGRAPLQEVWRVLDARSDRHELTRGEAGRGARDPEECWMRLSGSQRASKAFEARKQCRAESSGIGALRKMT